MTIVSAEDLTPLFTGRYGGGPGALGTGDGQAQTRQGIVTAWNSATGENTISVAGALLHNIPCIAIADSIMLTVGDPVVLLKVKSKWFISGRIAPPGGGAALGIRAASIQTAQNTTSTTYTNLATVGPTLTDVYIGSSRRCLVFFSASVNATTDIGSISVQVSGASTIAPATNRSAYLGSNAGTQILGTPMTFLLFTAADGLNSGLNTFQLKYLSSLGTSIQFGDRRIAVFPF